jgi:hypothetical protein
MNENILDTELNRDKLLLLLNKSRIKKLLFSKIFFQTVSKTFTYIRNCLKIG